MKTIEERIAELRGLLRNASSFAAVAESFQELGDSAELHRGSGSDGAEDLMQSMVEGAVSRVLKRPIRLEPFVCLRYCDSDFLHGAGPLGRDLVAFFYFQDVSLGLVILSWQGRAHYLRITASALPSNSVAVPRRGQG